MSESRKDTEFDERRQRNFQHDFAVAMWRDLPEDAKERLQENRGGQN